MFSKFLLYFHTIKHLRIRQIFWRIFYRCAIYTKPTLTNYWLRESNGEWLPSNNNKPSYFGNGKFLLLNQSLKLIDSSSWNDDNREKLLTYNLHYFDDLSAIDYLTKESCHTQLIERWIKENPPVSGNGWEPYTLSLRIVNWIKWSLNRNIELTKVASDSLFLQMVSLSSRVEHHILGNHILANAKALIFAGCYFDGPKATKAFIKGINILVQEIEEQVLSDGGHFELSPMYHLIVLEDLLDVYNLSLSYNCFELELMSKIEEVIIDMLRWAKTMSHPDGGIAFFNDAAFGIAKSLATIEKYSLELGIKGDGRNKNDLGESGYRILQNDNAKLICDVGMVGPDYLPGHAHADTLSFELSLGQQRVFVNSGTSIYGLSSLRHIQRGTRAHNTVVVNDKNSSNVWGGFRVAERARVYGISLVVDEKEALLSAWHDGYKGATHQRQWNLRTSGMSIIDKVNGDCKNATAYFYLHPEIEVIEVMSNSFELVKGDALLASVKISHGEAELVGSLYWPEFGVSYENEVIKVNLVNNISEILVEFAR